MSQRLVDAVHRLQTPLTRLPSTDLSQLWPVRQKLSQLNRLKICHFLTNYKSEQIYTVTYNYIFHENVSNVNPFVLSWASFQPDKTSTVGSKLINYLFSIL